MDVGGGSPVCKSKGRSKESKTLNPLPPLTVDSRLGERSLTGFQPVMMNGVLCRRGPPSVTDRVKWGCYQIDSREGSFKGYERKSLRHWILSICPVLNNGGNVFISLPSSLVSVEGKLS